MQIRKPIGIDSRIQRRENWNRKAIDYLGAIADNPLVAQLLSLVDDNELGTALENVGLLKASYGTIVRPDEVAKYALECCRKSLKEPKQ